MIATVNAAEHKTNTGTFRVASFKVGLFRVGSFRVGLIRVGSSAVVGCTESGAV